MHAVSSKDSVVLALEISNGAHAISSPTHCFLVLENVCRMQLENSKNAKSSL